MYCSITSIKLKQKPRHSLVFYAYPSFSNVCCSRTFLIKTNALKCAEVYFHKYP